MGSQSRTSRRAVSPLRSARTAFVAVTVLVALALTSTSCRGFGGDSPKADPGDGPGVQSEEPSSAPFVRRDVPSGDGVVDHPGAWLDPDGFVVDDAGDVLAFVVAGGVIPDDRCQVSAPAALLWQGHDGTRRALGGDVAGRRLAAAGGGGFVVGALPRRCGPPSDKEDAPGPYLVTATGATVRIRWPSGRDGRRARHVCAVEPDNGRCVFSATDATVLLLPPTPRAPNGSRGVRGPDGIVTARSIDSRQLWWSTDDGKSWQHRTTPLATRSHLVVSTLEVGDHEGAATLGFFTDREIDISLDAGRTWTVRPLPHDLPGGGHGEYSQVWVTDSGILIGSLTSTGHGDALVRSTDTTWSQLVATSVRAARQPLWVFVHGDVVNATNPDVTNVTTAGPWWVSTDAGASWRRNDLLP